MTEQTDGAERALETDSQEGDDADERRLHLKAFEYWRSLKGEAEYPLFRQLTVSALAAFKDQSLLVERGAQKSDGAYEPDSHITVRFFGSGLTPLFMSRPTVGDDFRTFSDSGFARELLSLLDNRSAADRAAEFEYVDLEVDSRGVMLPLSRDGDSVDFLWVVISAKSYAEAHDDLSLPTADVAVEAYEGMTLDSAPELTDFSGNSDAIQTDITLPPDDYDGPLDYTEDKPESPGVDPVDIEDNLALAQGEARAHLDASTPGFDRLYGLLADTLKLHEQAKIDPEPLRTRLDAEGLKIQERAPYTPILKLIFGKEYDKTRLTEYGAAIAYAVREGVTSDGLVAFLTGAPGGIKGCVRAERAARRGDKTTTAHSRLKAARRRLREAKPKPLDTVRLRGEFDVLLARRGSDGQAEILGRANVSESTLSAIIERRARKARRSKKS